MKVVIFCGGLGTRLREETEFKPKPMVEIGGKPVLWHIMERYAHYGFKDFILPLGYKGDVIKRYFCDYKIHNSDFSIDLSTGDIDIQGSACVDWKVSMTHTGLTANKGARLFRVARQIGDEPFMLTYGDGLADIDIHKLLAFHKSHGKIGTFTGVRIPSRFGTVKVSTSGKVETWQEKPLLDVYTNCGFFVFEPEIFTYLSDDDSCELEREPLEKLARDGQLLMYQHEGFWQCMDTLRDYDLLTSLWSKGNAPWVVYP